MFVVGSPYWCWLCGFDHGVLLASLGHRWCVPIGCGEDWAVADGVWTF